VWVAEDYQGTVGLGEERRQDVEQELLLQLAHVGVEPPVGLAVPLDVEEEYPPRTGLDVLRPANEPEEGARRVLEPLVGEHHVVERHAPSSDGFPPSRPLHRAVPSPPRFDPLPRLGHRRGGEIGHSASGCCPSRWRELLPAVTTQGSRRRFLAVEASRGIRKSPT